MIAVLVNLTAGKGRHAGRLPDLLDQLGDHEVLAAHSALSAAEALKEAVAGGAQAVVAIGGDGTVHLALQAVANTGIPLGIVPLGTGNDLAAGLGLPSDPHAAIQVLRRGRTRSVDLGHVSGDGVDTYFGTVVAAGFDALVNERANRMSWPKGPRRYDLAIVCEFASVRRMLYRLVVDGVETEEALTLLAVGNTSQYGGGMRICPGADPTDGLLDVTTGSGGRFTLARLKPRVRAGTHVKDSYVKTFRATSLEISGPDLCAYADGERLGPLPLKVTCVPGALTLLC
ncbi:MAG: NAD(+)/NADH kinase [Longispora sp.]|nr:NAD(+)/NADH kinase [Longispora sp. (in: high G+C Gram-positive bacteria)]